MRTITLDSDGVPRSPEEFHEFMRGVWLGLYRDEKARRAGEYEADTEVLPRFLVVDGQVYDRERPDIDISLTYYRQKLIDEYGVDPEDIDPPEG